MDYQEIEEVSAETLVESQLQHDRKSSLWKFKRPHYQRFRLQDQPTYAEFSRSRTLSPLVPAMVNSSIRTTDRDSLPTDWYCQRTADKLVGFGGNLRYWVGTAV